MSGFNIFRKVNNCKKLKYEIEGEFEQNDTYRNMLESIVVPIIRENRNLNKRCKFYSTELKKLKRNNKVCMTITEKYKIQKHERCKFCKEDVKGIAVNIRPVVVSKHSSPFKKIPNRLSPFVNVNSNIVPYRLPQRRVGFGLGDYLPTMKYNLVIGGIHTPNVFHLEFSKMSIAYPISFKVIENWLRVKLSKESEKTRSIISYKVNYKNSLHQIFKVLLVFGLNLDSFNKKNDLIVKKYADFIKGTNNKCFLENSKAISEKLYFHFNTYLTQIFNYSAVTTIRGLLENFKLSTKKIELAGFIRDLDNLGGIFSDVESRKNVLTYFQKTKSNTVKILNPYFFLF